MGASKIKNYRTRAQAAKIRDELKIHKGSTISKEFLRGVFVIAAGLVANKVHADMESALSAISKSGIVSHETLLRKFKEFTAAGNKIALDYCPGWCTLQYGSATTRNSL